MYEEVAQNGSITIDLPLKNDQSPNANWTYTLESLPLHGTIQPIRIGDPIPNGIIRYGAASNFVGVDDPMYKIHNETSSTNVGSITIKTYVTQPILSDPIQRMLVSFGIASVSIIAITVAAWYIISSCERVWILLTLPNSGILLDQIIWIQAYQSFNSSCGRLF